MNNNEKKVPIIQKFSVGAIAGVIGTSCIYPVDMVKTRLQNQIALPDGTLKYRNPFQCFQTILRTEGASGLYRGLSANLIGVTPEKAIKLAVNEILREKYTSDDGSIKLWQEMVSGAGAGFAQVIATNPMEIVKIRMQIQGQLPVAERKGLMGVVKELGPLGMYKGSSATLARDVPFSFMFFPLYANLKRIQADENGKTSFFGILSSGLIAGASASGLTTPVDVIKTRMQVPGAKDLGPITLVKNVIQTEGVEALFKGVVPRMSVVGSLFAISLFAFEMQKRFYLTGSVF